MLELFLEGRNHIQNAAALLLFAAALWKGGGPERICSGTVIGMVIAEFVYHAIFGPDEAFDRFHLWHFTLDSLALVVLVTVALQANRFYPMVLAAAQLVAFTSHIVRALVEPVSSLAYYLLYNMPFWFQLVILAIGIVRYGRNAADAATSKDWRPASRHARTVGYS